jgi:hypothetical protein
MTLAVVRHRRGGWVVVDGGETLSRHTTEWCAERVARSHALRQAGPRLGPLAASGPAPDAWERAPQAHRRESAATLGGALLLTTLLWCLIGGVVVLILQLLD